MKQITTIKAINLLIVILLVLVMSSCTNKDETPFVTSEDFYVGSVGLEYDFFESSPPSEIYQDTEFEIALDLENLGAYPLGGWITISTEDDYMCIINDDHECTEWEPSDLLGDDYVDIINLINGFKDEIDEKYKEVHDHTKQLRWYNKEPVDNVVVIQELNEKLDLLHVQISDLADKIDEEKEKLNPKNEAKTKHFFMVGKSLWNPQGGREMIKYNAKTKDIGIMSTRHESTLLASACYEYSAIATESVCIDTDINNMGTFEQVCEAEEIPLQDQGGPVAISEIETNMLPRTNPDGEQYVQPQFIIHVENRGDGRVINKEKIEDACTAAPLQKNDYNAVFLQSLILSTDMWNYHFNGFDPTTGKEIALSIDYDSIECTPNPLILQGNKFDYFKCTLTENVAEYAEELMANQPSYTTPLSITLSYGYLETRSKDITIIKDQ